MSDREKPSGDAPTGDDQPFLTRWARRKAQTRESPAPQPAATAQTQAQGQAQGQTQDQVQEPFDLTTLPRLEDIVAETDIRPFLHKAVPEGLRNAALRRVWQTDPMIRDYVDPARDYAWDWNTPGGVPGAGELIAGYDGGAQAMARLSSTSITTLVEEKPAGSGAGEQREIADSGAEPPVVASHNALQPLRLSSAQAPAEPQKMSTVQNDTVPNATASSTGEQGEAGGHAPQAAPEAAAPRARSHGGALPR